MPDKIRLLPDTVASQIAAGEVVNRPASVVKEMMENSVDAGATAITVSYRNGGKELIKVIDDGEGMSPLDARMAFDKHATSKITRIEDVYALHTFGFRGEALASIAAIAHVELTTRRPEDELGTQLVVEGSRFQSQENVVAPVGSQFAVKISSSTYRPDAGLWTRVRPNRVISPKSSGGWPCVIRRCRSRFTGRMLRCTRSILRDSSSESWVLSESTPPAICWKWEPRRRW